ncbi:hypothetical protein ACIXRX_17925 [Bacteroides fragilis]
MGHILMLQLIVYLQVVIVWMILDIFFKLNTAPVHHYKAFHDAGYETYDFNYPYYIIGNDVNKYIDHSIYSTGFIYGSEWRGIYSYYHDIIKVRPLNEYEHLLLKKTSSSDV